MWKYGNLYVTNMNMDLYADVSTSNVNLNKMKVTEVDKAENTTAVDIAKSNTVKAYSV